MCVCVTQTNVEIYNDDCHCASLGIEEVHVCLTDAIETSTKSTHSLVDHDLDNHHGDGNDKYLGNGDDGDDDDDVDDDGGALMMIVGSLVGAGAHPPLPRLDQPTVPTPPSPHPTPPSHPASPHSPHHTSPPSPHPTPTSPPPSHPASSPPPHPTHFSFFTFPSVLT